MHASSVAGSEAEVAFARAELAVTPGQGAAFYDGDRLLGGGWIESTERCDAARAEQVVGA